MTSTPDTLSILVVDEYVLLRKFLAEAITAIPGAALAGVAANGSFALQKLGSQQVDLILLGLEGEEGLATFHALHKGFPEIGIIVTGTREVEKVGLAGKAVQAGALHFLAHPDRLDLPGQILAFSRQLLPLLRQFSVQLDFRHKKPAPGTPYLHVKEPGSPAAEKHASNPSTIDLIAIAVSTGGPTALTQLIPLLPADLGVPVLIVQHMPAVFTATLAEALHAKSQLTVKEAEEGDLVLPNTVYIALGGRHMTVRGRNRWPPLEITLTDDPPVKSCRPSADKLFGSIAAEFHGHVLAVVMTGMGEDGADGVRKLKEAGCYCLSQSRESCVVYGMPKAVESCGLADEVLPLANLAARIIGLVKAKK